MKNDWVWRKGLERFITIIKVSINLIGVLLFQLVSIFKNVHSKFKSLLTQVLEMAEYGIYTFLFLITLHNKPRGL